MPFRSIQNMTYNIWKFLTWFDSTFMFLRKEYIIIKHQRMQLLYQTFLNCMSLHGNITYNKNFFNLRPSYSSVTDKIIGVYWIVHKTWIIVILKSDLIIKTGNVRFKVIDSSFDNCSFLNNSFDVVNVCYKKKFLKSIALHFGERMIFCESLALCHFAFVVYLPFSCSKNCCNL